MVEAEAGTPLVLPGSNPPISTCRVTAAVRDLRSDACKGADLSLSWLDPVQRGELGLRFSQAFRRVSSYSDAARFRPPR
jgi:hypothetical protein